MTHEELVKKEEAYRKYQRNIQAAELYYEEVHRFDGLLRDNIAQNRSRIGYKQRRKIVEADRDANG